PVRRGEPVTVGLPWPRGAVTDDRQFRLIGPAGAEEMLQTQVLDRWPDGTVRWCLFDFRATAGLGGNGYRIETGTTSRPSVQVDSMPHLVDAVRNLILSTSINSIAGDDRLDSVRFTEMTAGP